MVGFDNKAKYVIQTFCESLGIKNFPEFSYGSPRHSPQSGKGNKPIHIERGDISYFDKFTPYDINDIKYFIWKGEKIPILFYAPFNEKIDLFKEFKKTKILPVDIISSSFFFLSCWQEFTIKKRDARGRFPFSESIQAKLKITDFPIVNKYMSIFAEIINHKPADNKKFIVCLTHDIDYIKKWKKENYRQEIKDLLNKGALNIDYWVFDRICVEEKKRGFHSSFYFLTSEYNVSTPHFARLFKGLKKGGWEIGLHSKADNYKDIMQEKANLEKAANTKVSGLRYHWLKFDNPGAFNILEDAGIKYDTSLGFAESPGYRTGFSFPYHPYNIAKDKPFKLWELPLNIMDNSLFYSQKLSFKKSWQVIENFLLTNVKYNTCLVILWHEASFDNLNYIKLYTKTLDWIKENGGKGVSCEQVLKYWVQ